MSVVHPGDSLLELVRNATTRVVLVAPYIKSYTLRRVISVLPESVTSFICVTRWLPEDIASGVCDLEILDDLSSVRGGALLVHPHLHAKYYAAGSRCLVGSANLTGRGLGWHMPPNVELFVTLPADFEGLRKWETALLESAIPATRDLRDQLREEADRLREATPFRQPPEVEEPDSGETPVLWVPKCPVPDQLWLVYQGRAADRMVSSAYKAAQDDLAVLRPPHGLTQQLFELYIAGIFRQMPLMVEIDEYASTGLTDPQALQFLAKHIPAQSDVSLEQVWRVLKFWLTYFLPTSYRLETRQEVLIKGKELPRR